MKYYLDITKYKDDDYGLKTEKITMNKINFDKNNLTDDIICAEYYKKRKVRKDKSISSLIYNGSKEVKNGNLFFKTNHDDIFGINNLDTRLSDLKTLIDDVKESDGIYSYFNKSISKEVTVKLLVPGNKKGYNITEEKGILYMVGYLGNIILDDKYIDFDSIYSIKGESINYVNPFVGPFEIDHRKYFELIEQSAFGDNENLTLKRKR